jgi:hypothetical protein
VRYGYCCRQGVCLYGKWDEAKRACAFLTDDDLCSKHAEIVEDQKFSAMPMFGCGCSSPMFNERRNAKIRSMYGGIRREPAYNRQED